MWNAKKVSVIFPTYNEKKSVYNSIQDFKSTGVVDEIVVVNNNAIQGTSEEVARAGAIEIHEPRQGYGFAIRRGLEKTSGYYIIVSEPDGTFVGRDCLKLLSYADDFDVVYGTRTAKELIWEGANMGWFLKWGNWATAKLIEILFNTTSLTDVGCTMRLIRRPALNKIQPYFTVGGNFFGPEMMLLSCIKGLKMIQIPLNYQERVGASSVTGSLRKAFWLGIRMVLLILDYRIRKWVRPKYFTNEHNKK
jgi:glycosyltransferase involved in cell wall biosynthesis